MSAKGTREFGVFKHELLLAPRQVRVRLLERIEILMGEVASGKTYPFDYIVYRITDHRPDEVTPLVLSGEEAAVGLAGLLYDVGRSVPVAADSMPEPVLTVGELAGRWRISPATVLRWRREGLALRLLRFEGGRRRAAVRESLVLKFEAERARLIKRACGHRRLTDSERKAILESALVSIAREEPRERILPDLSDRFFLSRARLERFLAAQSRDNKILGALSRRGISVHESERILRAYLGGNSEEVIAAETGRPVGVVHGVILRGRARKLLRRLIRAIDNADFDAPGACERIAGNESAPCESGAPTSSGMDSPLLTRDEETVLFRKYNYLKHLALHLRERLDARRPDEALLARMEGLLARAERVRDRILCSNLRLVASIAKRHYRKGLSFSSIVSDGNMALLDAIESFDYSRGNRFSTYAGWAISRRFARTIPEETYRIVSVEDDVLAAAAKVEVDLTAVKPAVVAAGISKALSSLTRRERTVVEGRFGLGKHKQRATLAELGEIFGVTKERVRQIEAQALARLRRVVETTSPELVPE